jgi:hypothetical protein
VVIEVWVAVYVFNPHARQWIFSHYLTLFHRETPQTTRNRTSARLQQNLDYAPVNDPNGIAFF